MLLTLLLSQSAQWTQKLATGLCTIALVSSLSIYQRTVLADPLTVTQQHWQAIATANSDQTLSRYREDAVLWWNDGFNATAYRGEDIAQVWQNFFKAYQIEAYHVATRQRSDRLIAADVTLTARFVGGGTETLRIAYQAQVDKQGKIVQEVWQADPQLSVSNQCMELIHIG